MTFEELARRLSKMEQDLGCRWRGEWRVEREDGSEPYVLRRHGRESGEAVLRFKHPAEARIATAVLEAAATSRQSGPRLARESDESGRFAIFRGQNRIGSCEYRDPTGAGELEVAMQVAIHLATDPRALALLLATVAPSVLEVAGEMLDEEIARGRDWSRQRRRGRLVVAGEER